MDSPVVIEPQLAPESAPFVQMADSLHAMAQPLTILRGALGAMQLSGKVAPENERYLEMSSMQIERLCEMLSNLRNLVDAAQLEAGHTSRNR